MTPLPFILPLPTAHTQYPPSKAEHKGLPDTQVLFPLYCSSMGLEACLDLQQRAEKRLGGGGAGDTTWPRREIERRNIRKGDRVVTMTPEDIISHTMWGEEGIREEVTGTAVVFPMPLAPAWRPPVWKWTGEGKDEENGCPIVSLSTLVSL